MARVRGSSAWTRESVWVLRMMTKYHTNTHTLFFFYIFLTTFIQALSLPLSLPQTCSSSPTTQTHSLIKLGGSDKCCRCGKVASAAEKVIATGSVRKENLHVHTRYDTVVHDCITMYYSQGIRDVSPVPIVGGALSGWLKTMAKSAAKVKLHWHHLKEFKTKS